MHTLIGQKPMFYQSIKHRNSVFYNTSYWQLPTRGFSVTIYNSRGNQIDIAQIAIYNCFLQIKWNQIKSNVGFWGEGKTGVPGEKPLRAE